MELVLTSRNNKSIVYSNLEHLQKKAVILFIESEMYLEDGQWSSVGVPRTSNTACCCYYLVSYR